MKQLALTMSLATLIILFSSPLGSKPKLDELTAMNLRVTVLEHQVKVLGSYANYLLNYDYGLEEELYRLEGNQSPLPRPDREEDKI